MAKRTANSTARELFGVPWGRMEKREDRLSLALVLSRSDHEKFRMLAEEAASTEGHLARTSFSTLCRKFGISFQQLANEYKAQKKEEGLLRIHDRLPDIMEQMAVDAESRNEVCFKCDGSGKVKEKGGKEPCPICRGKGEIRQMGDTERLKLVLESARLIGRGNSPTVNLDLRQMGKSEKLESLSASVTGIIDGTVVDVVEARSADAEAEES